MLGHRPGRWPSIKPTLWLTMFVWVCYNRVRVQLFISQLNRAILFGNTKRSLSQGRILVL